MIYTDPFINSIARIVDRVLEGLDMYSQDAFELVMRTGMQESKFRYLEQIGGGPGLGFFQTEPGMTGAEDAWYNYLVFREGLRGRMKGLSIPMGPWDDFTIMSNLALQVSLCRIKYRRISDPIPSTIEEQANYWKRIYNTDQGAGKPEEFVDSARALEAMKEVPS